MAVFRYFFTSAKWTLYCCYFGYHNNYPLSFFIIIISAVSQNTLGHYPIFNVVIENKIFNEIYVTDEFKNYVEEVNIEGFEFIEVFDFENEEK